MRCQRSSASLLPKTARLKTSHKTNPPLPLLRTPPQSPQQRSNILTYNQSRGEPSWNLSVPHCPTGAPQSADYWLSLFKIRPADHDQPMSKDEISASAEGILQAQCQFAHIILAVCFYFVTVIVTHPAALWVCLFYFVFWSLVCQLSLGFSSPLRFSCV